MLYNLTNDLDRERIRARLEADLQRGSVVEYTRKEQRTNNQNRYLHLVLGAVAIETGNDLEFTKQQYFKKLVNPDLFVLEKEDRLAGKVEVLASSRDLTVEQMSTAIDRFKRWAAENGIYIPDPEDAARLQEIEIEMARLSRYL